MILKTTTIGGAIVGILMAWGPFIEPVQDWLHSMCTLEYLLQLFHTPALTVFSCLSYVLPPHGDAGWMFKFGFLGPLCIAIQWVLLGCIVGVGVILVRKARTQPPPPGDSSTRGAGLGTPEK